MPCRVMHACAAVGNMYDVDCGRIMAAGWSESRALIPCPWCSVLASRHHQQRCEKKIVPCPQCGERLSAAAVDVHMKEQCSHRKESCPGCSAAVLQKDVQAHLLNHCKARSWVCRDCGQGFWIAAEFVSHALPSCSRKMVACQLCHAVVPTAELSRHLVVCAQSAEAKRKAASQPRSSMQPRSSLRARGTSRSTSPASHPAPPQQQAVDSSIGPWATTDDMPALMPRTPRSVTPAATRHVTPPKETSHRSLTPKRSGATPSLLATSPANFTATLSQIPRSTTPRRSPAAMYRQSSTSPAMSERSPTMCETMSRAMSRLRAIASTQSTGNGSTVQRASASPPREEDSGSARPASPTPSHRTPGLQRSKSPSSLPAATARSVPVKTVKASVTAALMAARKPP